MLGLLEQIREGSFPNQAKRALVQGILPIEPELFLQAVFLVCRNEQEYLSDAKSSFEELPDGVKVGYFGDKEIDPALLNFYLTSFSISEQVRHVALLNPMIAGSTIRILAPRLEPQLLDLAVNNQAKILEDPGIIEALRANPHLSIIHKQKLDEYGRLLLKELVSPAEELEHRSLEEIEAEAIEEAKQFIKVFGREANVPVGDITEEGEEVLIEKPKQSLLAKIQNMSVPQKIQLAIKGDRSSRSILIRDANKLVCTSVIKSPKITEAEIEFFSNLRNVQADVLRLIAMNREWVKNYKVIHNLVKNPRTPLTFTLKFLPYIQQKDLKFLIRDKGVPEALRTLARRMIRGDDKKK